MTPHVLGLALCGLMASHAMAQGIGTSGTATPPERDQRFVVLHTPGPAWNFGRSVFEQEGLKAHVEHYRRWHAQGKLELGGPYLDSAAGGMMIPVAGLSERDIRAHAFEDPAVKSGLLKVEVRPWLVGMKRSVSPGT